MKKYLKNEFDLVRYTEVADELPLWSAPFGLKLLDHIDYKPGITAIDIGFGTGFPLTEIALRLGDTSLIYGIDPWEDAISRATKKIDYYGLKNIKIIQGVAESIPVEDDSVDLITSNNGINNVNDIDMVLSECSRIIKPGGQFVQTMNTSLTMFEFYRQLKQVLTELNMNKEIDLMHRHILQKRPPVDIMISTLEKHGFEIKGIEHSQFNYRFADGTTMLNHYFIRLAFMDAWIKFLPPDKTDHIFEITELNMNEQSKRDGGINLSIPFVLIDAIKK